MELLNGLLENKILEMIASGLVGWVITKILDPPRKSSKHYAFGNDLTISQVNTYVQQHIYPHKPGRAPPSADAQQMFMLVLGVSSIGVLAAMVAYGTLVVQIVRFLVAATGFAAALLARIIFGSTAFRPYSWITRVAVMVAVCVLLWFSLNYVEDGITASIISAQRQGYRINNLPDMLTVFGFKGVLHLWHYALALWAAAFSSLVALMAQLHMLLSAHAATAFNPQEWRVRLLGFMGNRSAFRVFFSMVLMSLMAFGLASGLLQRLFNV